MKKEREKIEYTDKRITKAQQGFHIRGVLSLVAWFFFAVSVFMKLCFNKGLVSCILGLLDIETGHCSFFYPGALGEIAKTVGVFSLFIVWIYAELGKYELGRQYTDLLATFCEHYHLRALSYILAILACIYITTIDILESAGFAMVIAALGLWDQAWVLALFIFNPSVRKELAIERWKDTFKEKKDDGGQTLSLSELYILADNISIKDDFFDKLCECIAKGMLAFLTQNSSSASYGVVEIIDISHVWERMLDGRPDYERSMLLHNVLKHIDRNLQNDEADGKRRIIVCAGYLQQQIRHYTKTACPVSDQESNVLIHILSDISQLKHKQGNGRAGMNGNQTDMNGAHADVIDCLDTLYALLIWMHFLCNNIVLGQELQTFLSHYKQVYGDAFKNFFENFVRCTFDKETCDKYFNIAWKQVGKRSTDQENTK